eukprot:s3249_g9.t1
MGHFTRDHFGVSSFAGLPGAGVRQTACSKARYRDGAPEAIAKPRVHGSMLYWHNSPFLLRIPWGFRQRWHGLNDRYSQYPVAVACSHHFRPDNSTSRH